MPFDVGVHARALCPGPEGPGARSAHSEPTSRGSQEQESMQTTTQSTVLERMRTVEVGAHVGERVRVAGWLQSLRRLGAVSFLILRDGWGTLQAVAESEAELGPLATGEAGTETVLAVEGRVVRTPEAPGGIELHELRVELISPVTAPTPLALSKRALKAAVPTL